MIFVFLFRICFPLYDSPLSLCVLNYKMYGQTNPIKKPRVKLNTFLGRKLLSSSFCTIPLVTFNCKLRLPIVFPLPGIPGFATPCLCGLAKATQPLWPSVSSSMI